jgi:histidinol-phosphate phosphatase family protein
VISAEQSRANGESAPAVFLDRDGTLMEEVDYCREPEKVRILPGVVEGLAALKAAGYFRVIVTNQSGIGRGRITMDEYEAVQCRLLELLGPGSIEAVEFCPDAPGVASDRRKPGAGMIFAAQETLNIDLSRSWLIGDKSSDVRCGLNAGVKSILVKTGYGANEDASGAAYVAADFADAVRYILGALDS